METTTQVSSAAARQAHRLIQAGLLLFFLALVVGLLVPRFAIPRLGLSAHLLGVMQGIFLVGVGLLWPKMRLGGAARSTAFWLLIYGCVAAATATVAAGIWRAGGGLLPNAAGAARGTPLQEWIITLTLRSSGAALLVALLLLLWGTRRLVGGEPEL